MLRDEILDEYMDLITPPTMDNFSKKVKPMVH